MMKEALFSSTELKTGRDRVIAAWGKRSDFQGSVIYMVTEAGRVYEMSVGEQAGRWLDWEEAET